VENRARRHLMGWRRLRWLVVAGAALALALSASACGGDDDDEAAPGTTAAAGECPFPDGVIRGFTTIDVAGTSGDLGLGTKRAADLSVELINAGDGILGCRFELDIVDEGFPEVDVCLRAYREALGQGDKYAFFFGPTGSGCMASVTDLTNAAGKPIIANQAADHQPFFDPKFQKLNFHAAVSTFLEGRASAQFAADKGWQRMAILAPNYAYGQDAAKAFKEYFTRIVSGGEIVQEQFPEFDERNFTPFINAVVARNPDGIFSAFFAGFVIPFWQQWKAGGHDTIPAIGGLIDTPGWELVKNRGQIPRNSYAYDRGAWQLASLTPTGKEFHDAYVEKHGNGDHPLPLAWGQAFWSGVLMVKALVETTESLDGNDWVEAVASGDFVFPSPFHAGDTPVNPINHMADSCAQVGLITYDESLPVAASYDLGDTQNICMHDVLESDEAQEITSNPDVSDDAISAYESNVEEVKEADAEIEELGR
jgi:ABC-type branched-subunit amino acid transport system substrate-binding protein